MATTQEHRSVDERRDQLVDAALEVMRHAGLGAVTTRAVTTQAGLPHGSFHYCFRTKADMFRAVLTRQMRSAMAEAFALSTADLPPAERIVAGLTAHLDRTRAEPDTALALLELVALSRRDEMLRGITRWEQGAYIDAVREHVDQWSTHQNIRWSAPLEQVARLLVATADGISATWLSDRDDAGAATSITLAARTIAALAKGRTP